MPDAASALPPAPVPTPPYARTGRRLGRTLLAFVGLVVGIVTLEPFRFAWPTAVSLTWADSPAEMAANVVLFLPLGFLAAFAAAADGAPADAAARRRRTLAIGALGVLASALIETLQAFEPARYPSPTDVLTNGTGALLGAWLHARLARRLGADSPLVGRLALELPLVGLLYVAVPLATLAGTTLADATGVRTGLQSIGRFQPPPVEGGLASVAAPRTLGLLALAGLAGVVLGTLQRHRFGPDGTLGRRGAALAAAGGMLAAAVPAAAFHPRALLAAAALAAGAAWLVAGARPADVERRFESEGLARATPFLAAYLLLLPLGDPPIALAPGVEPPKLLIIRSLEWGVAFAVLGYLLAEAWGRRELRFRHVAWRVALVAGVVVHLLALLTWAIDAPPIATTALLGRMAAALGGAWLYHLQRDHVRALVAARQAGAAEPRRLRLVRRDAASAVDAPRRPSHDGRVA